MNSNRDAFIVQLLKLQAEHDQKLDRLRIAVGRIVGPRVDVGELIEQFRMDTLDLVLDHLGVPQDNTVEQSDTLGHQVSLFHPDTFCRDHFDEKWQKVEGRGAKAIEAFPSWVRSELDRFKRRVQDS